MPIFDQGYQHWNGPLSGHAWRWYTIARHGVRAQLKNLFVRLLLLAAWIPALALAATLALWGMLEQQVESVLPFLKALLPANVISSPAEYRGAMWTISYSFFFKTELIVVLLLVLVVGPNLISRDIRFNALPLYLARPVQRVHYFLGKLGVIAFFIGAVVMAPAVLAYFLGVGLSLSFSVLRDTHHVLWGSLGYAAVITLSTGTLMLALSSLSRRSVYVALTWVGIWIISFTVSGILVGIHRGTLRREIRNQTMRQWIQDNPPPEGIEIIGGIRPRFHFRQPQTPEQREWMEQWGQAWQKARNQVVAEEVKLRARDWRPLCSYGHNLDRLGDVFLGTDEAWVTWGKALAVPKAMLGGPQPQRPGGDRFLANQMAYQYPWVWSAGVLAGLLGISLWTLSFRVKSLDRLK